MMEKSFGRRSLQTFEFQRYLVILSKLLPPNEMKALLDNVFGAAWRLGITDVNALVYNSNASWSLITYLPYGSEDCITSTYTNLTTLTEANYTRFSEMPFTELFIRKMRNMRKCPITIIVYPCDPYVFVTENGAKVDGIEIRIVEAVAGLLNFTPIYILPEDRDGNRWPNVTKAKCLEMVMIFFGSQFLFHSFINDNL